MEEASRATISRRPCSRRHSKSWAWAAAQRVKPRTPPPERLKPARREAMSNAPVPIGLQHLHQCLLDEAVEHRGNPERPCATRGLRYLHPPHRLRLVGAVKQLRPDREPVLLQMGRQSLEAHSV